MMQETTLDCPQNIAPASENVPAQTSRWALLWFGGLLALSYGCVLSRLGKQWFIDDDMSHGMFVPVLVAYIVKQRWPVLRCCRLAPNAWGVLLMIAGAFMLCIGPPSLPTFVFLSRLGFIFSLVGVIVFLCGTPIIVELAYPLMLLLFMIPPPGFVFQKITLPLQFVASILSEHILSLLGYTVLREGNVLHMPAQTLNVVEACSGLRSLLSLSFLAQAYAYLFDKRSWMRFAMGLGIVPIAVLANAGRIAISAMAGEVNPDWGRGLYHDITGWAMFAFSFLCLVTAHWSSKRAPRLWDRIAFTNDAH